MEKLFGDGICNMRAQPKQKTVTRVPSGENTNIKPPSLSYHARGISYCFHVRLENGQIQHLTEENNAFTKLMLYWLAKDAKHIYMKPEVRVVGFPDSDNYLALFHSELESHTNWDKILLTSALYAEISSNNSEMEWHLCSNTFKR